MTPSSPEGPATHLERRTAVELGRRGALLAETLARLGRWRSSYQIRSQSAIGRMRSRHRRAAIAQEAERDERLLIVKGVDPTPITDAAGPSSEGPPVPGSSAPGQMIGVGNPPGCLQGANPTAYIREYGATVLRVVLSPYYGARGTNGQAIPCLTAAIAAGARVEISIQWRSTRGRATGGAGLADHTYGVPAGYPTVSDFSELAASYGMPLWCTEGLNGPGSRRNR